MLTRAYGAAAVIGALAGAVLNVLLSLKNWAFLDTDAMAIAGAAIAVWWIYSQQEPVDARTRKHLKRQLLFRALYMKFFNRTIELDPKIMEYMSVMTEDQNHNWRWRKLIREAALSNDDGLNELAVEMRRLKLAPSDYQSMFNKLIKTIQVVGASAYEPTIADLINVGRTWKMSDGYMADSFAHAGLPISQLKNTEHRTRRSIVPVEIQEQSFAG